MAEFRGRHRPVPRAMASTGAPAIRGGRRRWESPLRQGTHPPQDHAFGPVRGPATNSPGAGPQQRGDMSLGLTSGSRRGASMGSGALRKWVTCRRRPGRGSDFGGWVGETRRLRHDSAVVLAHPTPAARYSPRRAIWDVVVDTPSSVPTPSGPGSACLSARASHPELLPHLRRPERRPDAAGSTTRFADGLTMSVCRADAGAERLAGEAEDLVRLCARACRRQYDPPMSSTFSRLRRSTRRLDDWNDRGAGPASTNPARPGRLRSRTTTRRIGYRADGGGGPRRRGSERMREVEGRDSLLRASSTAFSLRVSERVEAARPARSATPSAPYRGPHHGYQRRATPTACMIERFPAATGHAHRLPPASPPGHHPRARIAPTAVFPLVRRASSPFGRTSPPHPPGRRALAGRRRAAPVRVLTVMALAASRRMPRRDVAVEGRFGDLGLHQCRGLRSSRSSAPSAAITAPGWGWRRSPPTRPGSLRRRGYYYCRPACGGAGGHCRGRG